MESVYLWLKFLHIVAAAVWIGGMVALVSINARLARAGGPAASAALGQQSEFFGRSVIGPAMLIVLLAGLGMAGQAGIPFNSLWIVWGLVGFLLSVAIGDVAVGRTGAQLGEVSRTAGPDDPRAEALRGRLVTLNVVNLIILASIVWAMVFRPTM